MRILLITQFFAPDITAGAFRLTDFARLLAADKHEVRVITSFPHKAHVEEVNDAAMAEIGIQITRCVIREIPAGGGSRDYIKHYISFVRNSLRQGIGIWWKGWHPDLVYVSSPPLFVGFTGTVLSWLFRCPMVFEVRDIWPDSAVAAGQLRSGSFAYRLGRWMERFFYRRATQITCVSQPMREYLQTQCRRPITVVYNGVDVGPSKVVECPGTSFAERVQRAERKILYAGNVGFAQELDLLVKAFAELRHEPWMKNWHVELLGTGTQLERLRDLARELDLGDQVRFSPAVGRDEAAQRMADSDILYLNLRNDTALAKTIPSKLFDYLLAAQPIVAGLEGEGRRLLESTGANVVFPPGDSVGVRDGLSRAVREWTTLQSQACRNRQLVFERFTRQQAYATLRGVFQSVLAKR